MTRKRSALSTIWSSVASTVAGWFGGGYNATDPRRKLIEKWIGQQNINRQTANQILSGSLPGLRAYGRSLERNNPSARAAIEGLVGLVVGSGIALEPQSDVVPQASLRRISKWWNDWCRQASVDGCDIYELQRRTMREVVPAGEALWRVVYDPRRFGLLPRILLLESEWLSDLPPQDQHAENPAVAGIKLDHYGLPESYYISPPQAPYGDGEWVKAKDIIHVFERRRSQQARGESWFAPVIETLMNERDLVDAELHAAKSTASLGIAITSQYHGPLDTTEYGSADDPVHNLKLDNVVRLYPGEAVTPFGHTRPSQQIAPFRQMLRGDLAASLRLPQRFLDRDVSRANFSSMRADMIDGERLLGPVREWVGHQTAGECFRRMLPYCLDDLGLPQEWASIINYRLLPDGQPYVDPVKDVAADAAAQAAGFSTYEQIISRRGGDWREVLDQRRRESAVIAQSDVARIVAIKQAVDAANEEFPDLGLSWEPVAAIVGASNAPGAYMAGAAKLKQAQELAEQTDVMQDQQEVQP